MSADGRFIAFATEATNVGFADNNGNSSDIIIVDRETGQRDRVEKSENPRNHALEAALKKKIKKLKKALKRAKKGGKKAAVKRIKKQLNALQVS